LHQWSWHVFCSNSPFIPDELSVPVLLKRANKNNYLNNFKVNIKNELNNIIYYQLWYLSIKYIRGDNFDFKSAKYT
jgi:hypothetical protein